MVEIVLDQATIQTIIAALVPLVAYVIAYLKKKLSNEQGDMAFKTMNDWAKKVKELSVVFPDLGPIAIDLEEAVAHAEILWKDPVNNSTELAIVFAKASALFSKAMDIVAKTQADKAASTVSEVKGA